MIIGAAFNYYFLYRYGINHNKINPIPRTAVSPKIGIFWGVILVGMLVLTNLVFSKIGYVSADLSYGMWGYALGMAMFISGIIAPGFFILGIIAGFGIPLMFYFSMEAGMVLYAFVSLMMAVYGLYLLKK